jgi:hypothetical protein
MNDKKIIMFSCEEMDINATDFYVMFDANSDLDVIENELIKYKERVSDYNIHDFIDILNEKGIKCELITYDYRIML